MCAQVSRSFGDVQFKSSGCSARPDVTAFSISARDRFLLCGCDGFFSVGTAPGDACNRRCLRHVSVRASTPQQRARRGRPAMHCRQVMEPQATIEMAAALLDAGREPKAVTNRLLNEAVVVRKCKDNCSVLLVVFQHDGASQGELQAAAAKADEQPGATAG